MMIIAVASDGNMVAGHFGRCPEYTLFRVEEGRVSEKKTVANPGHEPGFLPGYLAKMGVKCIIAGGMGPRTQSLFAVEDIETFTGIRGQVGDVIDAYLSGSLESGESTCEHSQGDHNCG